MNGSHAAGSPDEVQRWLEDLGLRELRPGPWGLDAPRELLRRLGNPHESFRALHVAGTRGKGSTCALLSSALSHAGFRVGLTTSPHLASPRERVRFGGEPIALPFLLGFVERVRDAGADLDPGYFEVMTAAAFLAFAEASVDVAVVEVGLGGRLDATNVVIPWVTGITRLGMDHPERLGTTRAAIAREKAGILKAGAPAVLAPNHPEAVAAVLARAREIGVRVRCISEEDTRRAAAVGLPGLVQAENSAVAQAMLEELAVASDGRVVVPDDAMRRGFLAARWPARLELREAAMSVEPRVDLLLDVAHDVDSVMALCAHARTLAPPAALIFSCLREKDLDSIARALSETAEMRGAVVLVPELTSPRARAARDVVDALGAVGMSAHAVESVAVALERARDIAVARAGAAGTARDADAQLIMAFGSFVIASDVIRSLDLMSP